MLRGGGGTAEVVGPGAPVLAFTPVDHLAWTWPAEDPVNWSIEESSDGVSGWVEVDLEPGTLRNADGVTTIGKFYRVSGTDGDDLRITNYSNVVEASV